VAKNKEFKAFVPLSTNPVRESIAQETGFGVDLSKTGNAGSLSRYGVVIAPALVSVFWTFPIEQVRLWPCGFSPPQSWCLMRIEYYVEFYEEWGYYMIVGGVIHAEYQACVRSAQLQ